MIISASRRTDIPAFYAEWFMGRIRANFCKVTNPFNPRLVSEVSLRPDDVDAIAFWTRNAAPLLPHFSELSARGFPFYFLYTLTGYPRAVEPNTPLLEDALHTMERVVGEIGVERLIWRYDPIFVTSIMPVSYHLEQFAMLARRLCGLTKRVVISMVDDYRCARGRLEKLARRGIAPQNIAPDSVEYESLMRGLAKIARAQGLTIASCVGKMDLRPFGIEESACIGAEYIRRVFGVEVSPKKDKYQRAGCNCVASKDIGAYDSCLHECAYCYATNSLQFARERHVAHDPTGEFLMPPVERVETRQLSLPDS